MTGCDRLFQAVQQHALGADGKTRLHLRASVQICSWLLPSSGPKSPVLRCFRYRTL